MVEWAFGGSRIGERLDIVLINSALLNTFLEDLLSYLPRTSLDHCAMLVELSKPKLCYRPSPFRFSHDAVLPSWTFRHYWRMLGFAY